jgi:hypothetical protein
MPIRSLIIFGIKVALAVGLWVAPAYAQDPAVVNSKTIRVRFENDHVRVLEATLPPGPRSRCTRTPPTSFMFWREVGIATTQQMARSRRARYKRATLSIATL